MIDVTVVIPTLDYRSAFEAEVSAHQADADQVVTVIDGNQRTLNELLALDGDSEPDHERSPIDWYETLTSTTISTIHAGVCHARNLGIHMAWNDLIVPLDADDELLPDGLKHLVEAWQPGTLVYGGWMEGDQYVSPPPPEMLHRKHVAHATWLFHKDDWAKVGGYDPDFNIGGEDWSFMCALVEAGIRPIRIDVPIYRRTVHAGSRTDQARSRIDFIRQLLREKYPKVMNAQQAHS